MTPTFTKVYRWPGQPKVKQFATCNVAIHTASVKGTALEGAGDKLMNTAAHKLRLETLRKHGKKALARTFK